MITQGKQSYLCGPTALANAMELVGKKHSLKKVIEACGDIVDYTDEYSLLRGAESLGFVSHVLPTHNLKAAKRWAMSIRAGIICAYDWAHWVTIHGMEDRVIMFDPEQRQPEVLSWAALNNRWRLDPREQTNKRHWTYFGIALFRQ